MFSGAGTHSQISSQRTALRAAAKAHGWSVVAEYQDMCSRDHLPEVLARMRYADVLLVWALDRLGRQRSEVDPVFEEVRAMPVEVYVASTGDTLRLDEELQLNRRLLAVAQNEADMR